MQPLASIPSPSSGVAHLGPLPLRAYAVLIIIGVIVAVWVGERRWTARGGKQGTVVDVAVWAVPFGLVGGRLYHVITDHQLYFGEGRHPVDALKVWEGGLSVWGAIALGALGAYLACRSREVSLSALADAAAPGIALAQAIGRWGNWFNQELYGRPTKLPWAVEIDPAHRPPTTPDIATYHPTFLYESLWCVGVAVLVIWAERRYRLGHGRAFALYVAAYAVGRAWIEWLRVDEAHHFLGLRLNDWTALVVFLAAVAYLYLYRNKGGQPVAVAEPAGTEETAVAPAEEPGDDTSPESAADEKPAEAGEHGETAVDEAGPADEPDDAEETGAAREPAGSGDSADPEESSESEDHGGPEAAERLEEPEHAEHKDASEERERARAKEGQEAQ